MVQTIRPQAERRHRPLMSIGATVVLAGVLAGCASGGGDTDGESNGFEVGGGPTVVDQERWDEILEAAQQEGEVILYRSLRGSDRIFEDFEADTGIRVESIYGATGETISRLDQEIDAGVSGADMTMHASPGWFDASTDKFVSLLVSPEMAEAGWEERLNGMSYPQVYSQPYSLAYNTNGEVPPTDLKEFLDANPDARIGLVDPAIASSIAFQYEVLREEFGDEILDQLAATNYVIEPNNTALADNLAAGTYNYAFPNQTTSVQPLMEEGAPVDIVWPTTALAGSLYNVAAIKNGPNPNATMVLINWMMSEAGATSFVDQLAGGSVPIEVEGSVPWGDVATLDPDVWTTEYFQAWLEEHWAPRFG